jgi:hypothetical protein
MMLLASLAQCVGRPTCPASPCVASNLPAGRR